MTVAQIVLLVVGIVFVVMSFFVIDRYEEIRKSSKATNMKNGLTEEELEGMRNQIKEMFEEEDIKHQEDIEEKLSKLSNDTIIQVSEFSNQVLAKIDHNNEEVVFLYNMLTNKEEEFKSIWSKMEQARRENKELLNKIAELKLARAKSLENRGLKASSEKQQTSKTAENEKIEVDSKRKVKTSNTPKDNQETEREKDGKEMNLGSVLDHELNDMITSEENVQDNKDEILKLYKEGKSVADISKELSLGRGEVKLVIDLYGH